MINIAATVDVSQLQHYLGRLPAELNAALNRIIARAAFSIEAHAVPRTPVRTGRLQGSIHTTVGTLNAVVSTATNYAVYVHDGTRYMAARPFMLWGVQDAEGDIESIVEDEIHTALA